jgi:hypothetical protein
MTVVNSPYPAPQNKHDDIFLSSAFKATNGGGGSGSGSTSMIFYLTSKF